MTENRPQLNAIEEEGTVAGARTRKPYSKPAIIHKQQIERSVWECPWAGRRTHWTLWG
jgi:hypothetical protein